MLRLFVGFSIPEDVCEHLVSLRGGLHNARWTPKENHHVTLKFIGEVDEALAEDVAGALQQIRSPAFETSLFQIGYFTKNKNEVRTLWTGVDNMPEVEHLHDKIETATMRSGCEHSNTRFHPHCTIAKLKGTSIDEVQKYVAMNNLFRSRSFMVEEFKLFQSRTNVKGSAYKVLAEFPLYQKIEQL